LLLIEASTESKNNRLPLKSDDVARLLKSRFYGISQDYNIEIDATISKMSGSKYLTVSSITTDFHSGSVNISNVSKAGGVVATFHTHPGPVNKWNRFSEGDIRSTLTNLRVNDYMASPNGLLQVFEYNRYNSVLGLKVNGLGVDRDTVILNMRNNVITERGGDYVRKFR
jgi:hypothetical protein